MKITLSTRCVVPCAVTLTCLPWAIVSAQELLPTFEEMLMTAQKHVENLQNLPIFIGATAENFVQPPTTSGLADSAVTVYVDGVYAGRSDVAMSAFQDVARVEVMKGPQGTLFGKNAAVDAPHPATFNAQLADNLFLRVNVLDDQRDGYRRNFATGRKVADENNSQSALGGFFAENAHADLSSTSAATYGDTTYVLTESTEVTVGLRYTRDEKDFTLTIVPNEFGPKPRTASMQAAE
jgi:outer membrane receptor protein involved in Fe transport